jgi:hypothetical protein
LEDRFASALNAGDVDAIMKVFVPDKSLVVFDALCHHDNMSAPMRFAKIGRNSLDV